MKKHLNQRKQYYIDCADLVIDVDNQKPKTIVSSIINQINHDNS